MTASRWRITGSVMVPRRRTASNISKAVGPLPHNTPPVDNETRSLPKVTFAKRQPSSCSPTRLAAGRRTSVKKTSLNVLAPVISRIGRISIPGRSIGQMKYETPLCLGASGFVRAIKMPYLAYCAPLVQIFCPLTMYSSPSRTARVPKFAKSLPLPGSLKSWHQKSSPDSKRGMYFFFCSSVPAKTIVGPAQPMPIGFDGRRIPA